VYCRAGYLARKSSIKLHPAGIMANYAKWDKFAADLSDDDADADVAQSTDNSDSDAYGGMPLDDMGHPKLTKPAGKPKFIKLASADDGSGLDPVYFTDPNEFVVADVVSSDLGGWGVPCGDIMSGMMRQMKMQFMYFSGDLKQPQEQFCSVLRARWLKKLEQEKATAAFQERSKCDVLLKITLLDEEKIADFQVFRRVRCSGSLTLRAFADKIVLPLMGWIRNYHMWYFMARNYEGAWAVPTESNAVDRMHLDNHGYCPIDDTKLRICDFLRKEGDDVFFLYDIGDSWRHSITLEKIYPLSESTGKAEVVAGAGACPPEDSNGLTGKGNHSFFEDVMKKRVKKNEASQALNYRNKGRFSAREFDLDDARKAVADAIASPASVVSGSKEFMMPLFGADDPLAGLYPPKRGIKQTAVPADVGVLRESLRTGDVAEPKRMGACVVCGSPLNAKLCSGCKLVRYCGRDCQTKHWPSHKVACKAAAAGSSKSTSA